MKKFIASLLCMALWVTLLPCVTYANDSVDETTENKYTSDEIIDLASSIWPEHEEKLRNPIVQPMTRTVDAEEDSVIIQESYNLSENEVIMYVEKESGTAFALIYESWKQSSQTTGSGYVEYKGNLYATCGACASSLINFTYRIYNSCYDKITNFGRFDNVNAYAIKQGQNDVETSSQPAYYSYTVNFVDPSYGWLYGSTIILLKVQNNEFYCSAE